MRLAQTEANPVVDRKREPEEFGAGKFHFHELAAGKLLDGEPGLWAGGVGVTALVSYGIRFWLK